MRILTDLTPLCGCSKSFYEPSPFLPLFVNNYFHLSTLLTLTYKLLTKLCEVWVNLLRVNYLFILGMDSMYCRHWGQGQDCRLHWGKKGFLSRLYVRGHSNNTWISFDWFLTPLHPVSFCDIGSSSPPPCGMWDFNFSKNNVNNVINSFKNSPKCKNRAQKLWEKCHVTLWQTPPLVSFGDNGPYPPLPRPTHKSVTYYLQGPL